MGNGFEMLTFNPKDYIVTVDFMLRLTLHIPEFKVKVLTQISLKWKRPVGKSPVYHPLT